MRTQYVLFVAVVGVVFSVALFCSGCAQMGGGRGEAVWQKVELDLSRLDADGLRGPADGKVSVSYEFAIPNRADCLAEVKAIDSTVQFMASSPGRIGATRQQCLCIGSTHQKDYADVIRSLADLPYIERIIECHFE